MLLPGYERRRWWRCDGDLRYGGQRLCGYVPCDCSCVVTLSLGATGADVVPAVAAIMTCWREMAYGASSSLKVSSEVG